MAWPHRSWRRSRRPCPRRWDTLCKRGCPLRARTCRSGTPRTRPRSPPPAWGRACPWGKSSRRCSPWPRSLPPTSPQGSSRILGFPTPPQRPPLGRRRTRSPRQSPRGAPGCKPCTSPRQIGTRAGAGRPGTRHRRPAPSPRSFLGRMTMMKQMAAMMMMMMMNPPHHSRGRGGRREGSQRGARGRARRWRAALPHIPGIEAENVELSSGVVSSLACF
mmetsp:Transcript_19373/g.43919  ORF Transcript_19373/g.43919 Transcript_19373/m.43919 type:complete len:218 (-) Transcript_19373:52-705(-)